MEVHFPGAWTPCSASQASSPPSLYGRFPCWQRWAPLELLSEEQTQEEQNQGGGAAPGVVSAGPSERRLRRGPTPPPGSLAEPEVRRGKQEGVAGPTPVRTSGGAGAEAAVSFPSSGAGPATWNPFLARCLPAPGSGPPSPGEQDGAVLQRAAVHRLPALPDQLGLGALHARPGAQGWNPLGTRPSPQVPRHLRRDEATPHPWQPCEGAPTLPAPLALLGTLLRQQLPAPRASESVPRCTARSRPTGAL